MTKKMKRILIFTVLAICSLTAFGQSYCIKVFKVAESPNPNGTIVLRFELTSATLPLNVELYTIDIIPVAGVDETAFFTFVNGINDIGPKALPLTLGTLNFKKNGTANIVFDLLLSADAPLVTSNFTFIPNDPTCTDLDLPTALLPLEWLSFKAKPINTPAGTKVALDWSTASEKDVKNFEVERSEDGKVFKKIGEPLPASNTVGNHNYSALDEKPLSGISYYRIRQTDYDGKTSVTKIESVNLSNGKTKGKFTFYPNPIHKGTPLSILTDVEGEYAFKVIDLTGRIVYNAKLKGSSELENMSLAGGTYLYQILSGDQRITGKIFVAE